MVAAFHRPFVGKKQPAFFRQTTPTRLLQWVNWTKFKGDSEKEKRAQIRNSIVVIYDKSIFYNLLHSMRAAVPYIHSILTLSNCKAILSQPIGIARKRRIHKILKNFFVAYQWFASTFLQLARVEERICVAAAALYYINQSSERILESYVVHSMIKAFVEFYNYNKVIVDYYYYYHSSKRWPWNTKVTLTPRAAGLLKILLLLLLHLLYK
jgi:hypothetical protein